MRSAIRLLAVLCVIAFASGQELGNEQRSVRVPASRVDPTIAGMCAVAGNGGVAAVTQHPDDPYVYAVRCRDGVTLVAGGR